MKPKKFPIFYGVRKKRRFFQTTKAQAMAARTIIIFIILLVVLVVMIFIFRTYIGKQTRIIGDQIESFGDCDDDGVANFLDKCPCIPFEEGYESQSSGCPQGTGPTKCTDSQIAECKK